MNKQRIKLFAKNNYNRIEKNIKYESVDVYFNENQIPKNIKIIDEYKCSDDSKEILIITPTTKYMNVSIMKKIIN